MNKKLPSFWDLFKIWAYLLMEFTLMKGGCNAEKNPNNGPENNFNMNVGRNQEIDWNIVPIEKVCMLGEQVALENEYASSGQENITSWMTL